MLSHAGHTNKEKFSPVQSIVNISRHVKISSFNKFLFGSHSEVERNRYTHPLSPDTLLFRTKSNYVSMPTWLESKKAEVSTDCQFFTADAHWPPNIMYVAKSLCWDHGNKHHGWISTSSSSILLKFFIFLCSSLSHSIRKNIGIIHSDKRFGWRMPERVGDEHNSR